MQNIVFRPVLGVLRNLQQAGMVARKVAPEKPLWTHVAQGIRQSVKPAVAHVAWQGPVKRQQELDGTALRIGGIHIGDLRAAPITVDSKWWKRNRRASDGPARRISGSPRLPTADHLRARRPNSTHQSRTTDLSANEQLPSRHSMPSSKYVENVCGHLYETI